MNETAKNSSRIVLGSVSPELKLANIITLHNPHVPLSLCEKRGHSSESGASLALSDRFSISSQTILPSSVTFRHSLVLSLCKVGMILSTQAKIRSRRLIGFTQGCPIANWRIITIKIVFLATISIKSSDSLRETQSVCAFHVSRFTHHMFGVFPKFPVHDHLSHLLVLPLCGSDEMNHIDSSAVIGRQEGGS